MFTVLELFFFFLMEHIYKSFILQMVQWPRLP